ncbi:MAG: DUF362 domain-containing protein [Deltaproteobacteria bacterium]|uniref:DUF362 domain-containing protein n=1 Tax=Candidatus Desulfacyla euxinica TaxID=2841693 RepID=A0A8J6MWW5_9DELT|nr:DUF362 domain-containing protein [Candidatus Desulfacyla euxinica]
MAQSKVWYSPAGATNWTESMICKAKDLFYAAGLDKCIEKDDSVAIKIHVGDYNRTACLRPEFVAAIVEEVKACGGRPFVTDTTTLTYHLYNNRCNAQMELEGANRHGFNWASFQAPMVIADGFFGEDDLRVELPEGNILKETYIARGIYEADACINLAHGKGHPITSMGACIKNFGIGAQSKRGKYQTHLSFWGDPEEAIGYPKVNKEGCKGLECPYAKMCEDSCPEEAIKIEADGVELDYTKCSLCYSCQVTCMFTGMEGIGFRDEYFPLAQIAMSDAALGCIKTFKAGKIGYMCYAIDIAPECDCFPWHGNYVAPDVGVFASMDPVAIDTAVADLIDKAPIGPNSRAEELGLKPGEDKFKAINAFTPRIKLKAAEKIGMGIMDYELIEYEPELNPENIAKWQIREIPMTVKPMRQAFKNHHLGRLIGSGHPLEFGRHKDVKTWTEEWKNFDPTI